MTTVIVDGACTVSAVVIPSVASCTLSFTLQTAICSQTQPRDLAARCARALRRLPPSITTRGRRESRVRAAPAVSCAIKSHKAHTSIQVQRRTPGFPCAVALRLIRDLPGEPSSVATVVPENLFLKNLAPASGARTTRLRRTREPRASSAAPASTASHRAFVTIATRPSHRVRRRAIACSEACRRGSCRPRRRV